MKISALAAATGIPKTTIHFYQREGLLPALVKTARNAATYGPAHMERLALIQRLRQARLPMVHLKRAVNLVEQGVPIDTAVALQQALTSGEGSQKLDLKSLAAGAGTTLAMASLCLQDGLLGEPGRRVFGDDDVAALRALASMRERGVSLAFLQESAERVQQLIAADFAMADELTAGMAQADRSAVLLALQEAVNCLHPFWLAQATRQQVFARWPAPLQQLMKEQQ